MVDMEMMIGEGEEKVITLEEHVSELDEELARVILKIAELSKIVRRELPHRLGKASTWNVSGEEQTKIDVWANELFTEGLMSTGLINQLASEETPEAIENKEGTGAFNITLDPLDGSSNIESNNLFGVICGIYDARHELPAMGRNLRAALTILYGPLTTMVYCARKGVHEFVKGRKERFEDVYALINENLKIPSKGKVYGVPSNREMWLPEFRHFIALLERENYALRYGGSFIGDVNQVLHKGGFFAYPAYLDRPHGKLRLQFEANPMSFIIEGAGGKSSVGRGSILDVKPTALHQRIPVYLGSKELIDQMETLFAKCRDARLYY
ncbi:fructose-bisphosphatase class I [Methanosarcinales archaeon]|nr:MAG: fructose-bisphosphatase class I [Methanosarcinales archaeon]